MKLLDQWVSGVVVTQGATALTERLHFWLALPGLPSFVSGEVTHPDEFLASIGHMLLFPVQR